MKKQKRGATPRRVGVRERGALKVAPGYSRGEGFGGAAIECLRTRGQLFK